MTPPKYIIQAIKSDATQFLWLSKPELDITVLGSHKKTGKWCSKNVEFQAEPKGGTGAMHLGNHMHAIKASWVVKLLDSRQALYKGILDMWLAPYDRSVLIMDLTPEDKK